MSRNKNKNKNKNKNRNHGSNNQNGGGNGNYGGNGGNRNQRGNNRGNRGKGNKRGGNRGGRGQYNNNHNNHGRNNGGGWQDDGNQIWQGGLTMPQYPYRELGGIYDPGEHVPWNPTGQSLKRKRNDMEDDWDGEQSRYSKQPRGSTDSDATTRYTPNAALVELVTQPSDSEDEGIDENGALRKYEKTVNMTDWAEYESYVKSSKERLQHEALTGLWHPDVDEGAIAKDKFLKIQYNGKFWDMTAEQIANLKAFWRSEVLDFFQASIAPAFRVPKELKEFNLGSDTTMALRGIEEILTQMAEQCEISGKEKEKKQIEAKLIEMVCMRKGVMEDKINAAGFFNGENVDPTMGRCVTLSEAIVQPTFVPFGGRLQLAPEPPAHSWNGNQQDGGGDQGGQQQQNNYEKGLNRHGNPRGKGGQNNRNNGGNGYNWDQEGGRGGNRGGQRGGNQGYQNNGNNGHNGNSKGNRGGNRGGHGGSNNNGNGNGNHRNNNNHNQKNGRQGGFKPNGNTQVGFAKKNNNRDYGDYDMID